MVWPNASWRGHEWPYHNHDHLYEASETVTITLSSASAGAGITDATGTLTITDNELSSVDNSVDNISVDIGNNTVLGFSLEGASIPQLEGRLIELDIDEVIDEKNTDDIPPFLKNIIISGENAIAIDVYDGNVCH